MNERIRELIEQATTKQDFYPAGCNGYPDYRYEFDKEKFAELLIRKCADIALQKGMASPDTDFRTGSYVINQYLLTHFGVEE